MPEWFALVHVRDMHFNNRCAYRLDAIGQCNAGVCVGSSVEHDAIAGESHLLQLVDEMAFVVALKVINLHVGEKRTQARQEIVERSVAIYVWFAHAQQVKVGPIDDLYRHVSFILYFCSQNYE
jgi:hypothetical protein